MYIVHILIKSSKFVQPKENALHDAGHYLSLVARGEIEPPTQEFSIPGSTGRYWPKADPQPLL
jgi:hypothetical protein